MDDIFKPVEKKRGINPVFIVGALVGLALIVVAFVVLLRRPSIDDQKAALLAAAYKEGSPEFAALNKDIIIATGENTVESPMGLGTVSMFIEGKVRNKGSKDISLLEINVAVLDQQNQTLKERRILVVPGQQTSLPAGETIPVNLTLDGFERRSDRAQIRWKVTAIK